MSLLSMWLGYLQSCWAASISAYWICILQDGELTPDDLLLMRKLGSLLATCSNNECISHEDSQH